MKIVFFFFAVGGVVLLTFTGCNSPDPIKKNGHDQTNNNKENPVNETAAARGKRWYGDAGCDLCHGSAGRGGIKNPNYIKDTAPALNTMAERMFLLEKEDRDIVIGVIESGKPLDQVEDLDVPRAAAVVSQYKNIKNVILAGNPAGKRDKDGPKPLDMPAWRDKLTEKQIDDIIAYLISVHVENGGK